MQNYGKARCEGIYLCGDFVLFCDEINGAHTTDLDAEGTEWLLESDARELVNFLTQLSKWYGSGDKRG